MRPLIEPEPVRTAAELLEVGFWTYSKKHQLFSLTGRARQILGAASLEEALEPADLERLRQLVRTDGALMLITALGGSGLPWDRVLFRGWQEYAGATRFVGTVAPIPNESKSGGNGCETNPLLLQAIEHGRDSLLILRAIRNLSGTPVDFEVVQANRNGAALLGGTPDDVKGRMLRQIMPSVEEDGTLERYAEVMNAGTPVEHEYHGAPGGFKRIWIRQRVAPIADGVAVYATDITDSKLANEAADRSRRMFEKIAATTPDALFLWDVDTRRLTYRNGQLTALFSFLNSASSAIPLALIENAAESASRENLKTYLAGLSTAETDSVVEEFFRFQALDDSTRLLFRSSVFDRKPDGMPRTILCSVHDVTLQSRSREMLETRMEELDLARAELEVKQRELMGLNQQLATMALTDAGTGIKNRRAFDEKLEEETERAQRYNSRLALLIADLDHFKRYNDTYGHPAGDLALRGFAQVLVDVCRKSDTVTRYGGEEFAILLPNTGANEAALLGERIRAALAATELGERGLTSSIGCAEFLPGKDATEKLVADADRALYESKGAGRNRVTIAGR